MARSMTSNINDTTDEMKKDFDVHAGRIRNEIASLASSVSEAGSNLASDAKAGASAKATELKQVTDQTIRDLRAQLEVLEKQVGDKVRERPVTALAIAAGVGFLVAMMARR